VGDAHRPPRDTVGGRPSAPPYDPPPDGLRTTPAAPPAVADGAEASRVAEAHAGATARLAAGDLAGAAAAFRAILADWPSHPAALRGLAATLDPGDPQRAALAARAGDSEAGQHAAAADWLLRLGREPAAIALLGRAAALASDPYDAALRLARLHAGRGETAAAAAAFARCLAARPGDPVATHLAEAASGRVPARAADAYLRSVFDGYADSFDSHLLDTLGYRAPGLVAAALAAPRAGSPAIDRPVATAVDLGCGTGLLGPLLRPLARHLAGVDLSAPMLEKARARGVYDRLDTAELGAWLAGFEAAWDLAAAADVLVYFGDLRPVLAVLARALCPGGRAAFTVERAAAGVTIAAHGRFQHGADHVRAAAAAAGLEVPTLDAAVLRQEGGRPVEGLVAVLVRPRGRSAGQSARR